MHTKKTVNNMAIHRSAALGEKKKEETEESGVCRTIGRRAQKGEWGVLSREKAPARRNATQNVFL